MDRNLDSYPDVLKPEEARIILGIGRNAIYKLLSTGQIQSIRIGKLYRIPKHSLLEFIGVCYNTGCVDKPPVSA